MEGDESIKQVATKHVFCSKPHYYETVYWIWLMWGGESHNSNSWLFCLPSPPLKLIKFNKDHKQQIFTASTWRAIHRKHPCVMSGCTCDGGCCLGAVGPLFSFLSAQMRARPQQRARYLSRVFSGLEDFLKGLKKVAFSERGERLESPAFRRKWTFWDPSI